MTVSFRERSVRPALRWTVAHVEEVVAALLLSAMIGSIGLSVFCRYVLQASLSWTEEVGEAPDLGRATERDASPAAWRLTTGTPRTREGRS